MELAQKDAGPPAGGGGDQPLKKKDPIDIAGAFKWVAADPDWLKKSAIVGLYMLIPIAGFLAVFGWMRRIFERVKRGQTGLPDIDFGPDLSYGIAPFVAMLNISLIVFAVYLVVGVAGVTLFAIADATCSSAVQSLAGVFMVLMQFVIMAMALGVNALMPEVWRRGFHGEMGPLFSPAVSIAAIKARPLACLLAVVGVMAASMAASVGVFLCYIGALVTMPAGYAVMAHIIAQWDDLVQGGDEPAEPSGGEQWAVGPTA